MFIFFVVFKSVLPHLFIFGIIFPNFTVVKVFLIGLLTGMELGIGSDPIKIKNKCMTGLLFSQVI